MGVEAARPLGRIDARFIVREASRDLVNEKLHSNPLARPLPDDPAAPLYVHTNDTINRNTSVSALLFEGAPSRERADLAPMWVILDSRARTPPTARLLEQAGASILTAQHAFGGVGRAVRKKLGTYEIDEVIAFALRTFGQGAKVAIEIALMAADAGLARTGEPCISIGGTERGADTALLLRPANAQTFFDLRVMEVLAKPRL